MLTPLEVIAIWPSQYAIMANDSVVCYKLYQYSSSQYSISNCNCNT